MDEAAPPAIQAWNIERQQAHPDEKIFFIGFNKMGTSSLHHLMQRNAIRSIHWKRGRAFIARIIADAVRDGSLKGALEPETAYCDLFCHDRDYIEANVYFREIHAAYPHAYFVLNDRNLERWLKSRRNHVGQLGGLLERQMRHFGESEEQILQRWRRQYRGHKKAVCEYFEGYERFMVFDIERGVQPLIAFLSPSYMLDPAQWGTFNKTSERRPRRL